MGNRAAFFLRKNHLIWKIANGKQRKRFPLGIFASVNALGQRAKTQRFQVRRKLLCGLQAIAEAFSRSGFSRSMVGNMLLCAGCAPCFLPGKQKTSAFEISQRRWF